MYNSKRHIAITRPLILSLARTYVSHSTCHFLKEFYKSSLVNVFSYATMAASISWINSKHLHFDNFEFKENQKITKCAPLTEKVAKDEPCCLYDPAFPSIAFCSCVHCIFDHHSERHSWKPTSSTTSEKGKNVGVSVSEGV